MVHTLLGLAHYVSGYNLTRPIEQNSTMEFIDHQPLRQILTQTRLIQRRGQSLLVFDIIELNLSW